jgi:hypothetical protein
MKFGFALFFERNAVAKESGTCQPERALLKGNFGRTGAIKAISINPREHPARNVGIKHGKTRNKSQLLRMI